MIKCASSRSRPRADRVMWPDRKRGMGELRPEIGTFDLVEYATWTDGRSVFTRQEKYWIKTIPSKG